VLDTAKQRHWQDPLSHPCPILRPLLPG